MIRYRKTELAVSNTYGMSPGTLLLLNGHEPLKVISVDHAALRVTVRRLTWLDSLRRRLTPPYRIGREGSSDRVILRLDRPHGLYLSIRLSSKRLRVAFGRAYTNTVRITGPNT